MNPWVEALRMAPWPDPPFELPEGVEARRVGDKAALHRVGTDKVVGFVPSRFDPSNLPRLLERIA